jgi:integrase
LPLTEAGKRMTAAMLHHRWNDAREAAVKATSEIANIDHASLLLGHAKGDITERVYLRVGALAKPNR